MSCDIDDEGCASVQDGLVLERDGPAADRDDGGKRRQILDGARQVFLSSGFDAASMNEIARAAGVSKGTLYVYFDSKEALFEALIREEKRAQAEQTCRFDMEDGDVRAVLCNVGFRLLDRMLDPELVAQLRTVIAVSAKFPRIGRAYYEAGPQFGLERLTAYLEAQVDAGHLAVPDTRIAAAQLIDLCKSYYFPRAIFCMEDRPSAEDLRRHIEQAVDLFMRSYGVKAPGS